MTTYSELIETFMHLQAPLSTNQTVRFEAIVAAVFGTKQRRFGPMPSPEIQVAVRDIVRLSEPNMTFFMPWGSRKQNDGQPLDVMEFMALQQLYCLKEELLRLGVASKYVFRLEDLTDRYLFPNPGGASEIQSAQYSSAFMQLGSKMLGDTSFQLESMRAPWNEFEQLADTYAPVFYKFLRGEEGLRSLQEIGWTGALPPEQQEYYTNAFRSYWPNAEGVDYKWEMAKYFAATLARVKLKATGAPSGTPHLLIAFTHPVPGNPVAKTRLHYRTIPQRYTNNHRSPWIGKGYFEIDEANQVTPKSAGVNEKLDFQTNVVEFAGVKIQADYVLKD